MARVDRAQFVNGHARGDGQEVTVNNSSYRHLVHSTQFCVSNSRNFPAGRNKSLPVVLDGGANLGSLSLPLLSRGYHVWAVEPLTMNVERASLALSLAKT